MNTKDIREKELRDRFERSWNGKFFPPNKNRPGIYTWRDPEPEEIEIFVMNFFLSELSTALDKQRGEVIEKVREMIEKEMAHTSPCEHQTPRTETASDYNCADIHIGRQEMGSDLLSSLNSLE